MGGTFTRIVTLAAVVVGLVASPAAAQDAGSTWTLDASVGVGGFVDPAQDTVVDVTLSSELLLVGRIDVSAGGSTTSEAIEIPAGGVKSLRITAAPVRDRRLVTVKLLDTSGETPQELESQQIRVTVPLRTIVVGLIRGEAAEAALRAATPEPIDFDVDIVRLGSGDVERGLGVIDYLVIGDNALADLSPSGVNAVAAWIDDGGVLVGAAADLVDLVDPAGAEVWPDTSVAVKTVGAGEVIAVDDVASVPVEDWNVVLRAIRNPGLTRDSGFDQGAGLVSAASAGREASVPGLPWLLAGIALFVVLIGPVNFLVLRRVRRPELAWFTVPALSVAFVAGFWIAGRAVVADAAVTSAAVVIDRGGEVTGRAGAVLQVATGGKRTLSFPEGWEIAPTAGFGLASGVRDADDPRAITFDLQDLGVGAAEARVSGIAPPALDIVVADDGATTVTNDTPLTFWSWGLVVDGVGYTVTTRDGDLLPGATQTLTVALRSRSTRYEPVVLETAQRRAFADPNFYETTYQVLNALSYEAESIARDLARNGTYFFGFTDSLDTTVAIDGRGSTASGSALLIKQFELPASLRSTRPVVPTLLDVEGSASVEQYYDEIYAYGADTFLLRYDVPAPRSGTASIRPSFTQLQEVDVYDWTTRQYVPYAWGDALDLGALVSPGGELVVRAGLADNQEFFEESFQLRNFELKWSTT